MRRIGPVIVGALVLLAVAALATMGLSWVRHQRGLREQLTARDAIHAQIRGLLLNQGVLKMAARFGGGPGNRELAACILPRHQEMPPCTVTTPELQKSFAVPEAMEPDSRLITGDVEGPARYSSTGAMSCDPDGSHCPGWIVTSWFWADCPGKAETCETAEAVHVRFQVQGAGVMAGAESNPPEASFALSPEAFAEVVPVTDGGAP